MILRTLLFILIAIATVSANTSVLSSIIVSNPSTFSTSDSTKIVSMQIHFDQRLPEKYLIQFVKSQDETHLYLVFKNTQFDSYSPDEELSQWIDVFTDSTDNYYDDVPFTILRIHLDQKVSIKSNWKDNVLTLKFSDKRLYSNYKNMYWVVPLTALTVGSILFLIESMILPATQ